MKSELKNKNYSFFAEKALKDAKLSVTGNLILFEFIDGSHLTILIEEGERKDERHNS